MNYSALFEIKIKERFQKRQALYMWLKGHEKDFLEWVEDMLGVVYAYMVFWNSEHLGASGIRLLYLLRLQRTPLKRFQIENHRKDLEPLNPYFPEGLKRPRDWPKATERSWAFWSLVPAFSTVALNFYGFYFLTITRLAFLFCLFLSVTYPASVLGTKSGI